MCGLLGREVTFFTCLGMFLAATLCSLLVEMLPTESMAIIWIVYMVSFLAYIASSVFLCIMKNDSFLND